MTRIVACVVALVGALLGGVCILGSGSDGSAQALPSYLCVYDKTVSVGSYAVSTPTACVPFIEHPR